MPPGGAAGVPPAERVCFGTTGRGFVGTMKEVPGLLEAGLVLPAAAASSAPRRVDTGVVLAEPAPEPCV